MENSAQLNSLNVEFEGKEIFIIDYVNKIKVFVRKVGNWRPAQNELRQLGNFGNNISC